jgi:hypothetical protein
MKRTGQGAPERGLAVWVIDGMGLTGSSAERQRLQYRPRGT